MFTATKDENIANLKSTAQGFRNAASDTADDARDNFSAAANNAGRQVRGLINSATDEITHAKETVTTQIRSNPVQSSLIALGIGVVLGALIRR